MRCEEREFSIDRTGTDIGADTQDEFALNLLDRATDKAANDRISHGSYGLGVASGCLLLFGDRRPTSAQLLSPVGMGAGVSGYVVAIRGKVSWGDAASRDS